MACQARDWVVLMDLHPSSVAVTVMSCGGMCCQAIEPVVGEALCRLFWPDDPIDLHAIALKSREAMDKRGLNPHKLYKRAELKRLASSC